MAEEPDRQDARRWRSANELARQYVGNPATINRTLKQLRYSLIADITEQTGMPWDDAASVVERNFVRRLGPGMKPGPKALLATDDAVRLSGIKPREAKEREEMMIESLISYRHRTYKETTDHSVNDGKQR
jgi:hypothetical protein